MNLKTELMAQLQVLAFLNALIMLFGYSIFHFGEISILRRSINPHLGQDCFNKNNYLLSEIYQENQ